METKVPVTEERIPYNSTPSIYQCFPSNISEPDSSVSDEKPLLRYSLSIASIFPPSISESNNSSVSGERLPQFCPSIQSIFPPTTSQASSLASHEIIPYTHSIESCFPARCDSDSFVSYDINTINRYWRAFSIQSFFPSFRSSSTTSVYDHPSPLVDSDRSLISESHPKRRILETPNLKEFTFADLKIATRNFRPDSLLGEGGFGRVFKGWMDEKTLAPSKVDTGRIVAIKKLNPEIIQDFQELQSELNFLGRLSHPNLVKLLGYCWKDKELSLVYEFLQMGSLENHLFRRNPNIEPLSWDLRLKIAIGAARGLAFLHASKKQFFYRDFKASNILLDGNYNAKISYFGLANFECHASKLNPDPLYYCSFPSDFAKILHHERLDKEDSYQEILKNGRVYEKYDVYRFGVVLLEMLSGLRALDTKRPRGQQNLVPRFLYDTRKLKTIMDVRMEGQYSSAAALKLARLIRECTTSEPSMKYVVEVLEHIEAKKKKPNKSKSNSTHSTAHTHGQ